MNERWWRLLGERPLPWLHGPALIGQRVWCHTESDADLLVVTRVVAGVAWGRPAQAHERRASADEAADVLLAGGQGEAAAVFALQRRYGLDEATARWFYGRAVYRRHKAAGEVYG